MFGRSSLWPRSRNCRSFADVTSDQQANAATATLTIDRDRAARFGIQPTLINATIYDAIGQNRQNTSRREASANKPARETAARSNTTVPLVCASHLEADNCPKGGVAMFPTAEYSALFLPRRLAS